MIKEQRFDLEHDRQLAQEEQTLARVISQEELDFGESVTSLFVGLFRQVSADQQFGWEIMAAGRDFDHQPQKDKREIEFEHLGCKYFFSYQLMISETRIINARISIFLDSSDWLHPQKGKMLEGEIAYRDLDIKLFGDMPVDVSGSLERRPKDEYNLAVFSGIGTSLLMIQDLVIRDLMKRSDRQAVWKVTMSDGAYDLETDTKEGEKELTGWTSRNAKKLGYLPDPSDPKEWQKGYLPE